MQINFVQTEMPIIETTKLTPTEKSIYTILKSFKNNKTGECFPSLRKIASRAAVSAGTVKRTRMKLKSVGVIAWETQKGRNHSCQYRFIFEDGTEEEKIAALDKLAYKKKGHLRPIITKNGPSADHLNRSSVDHLNGSSQIHKMGHPRPTNHMFLTRRNITKQSDAKNNDPGNDKTLSPGTFDDEMVLVSFRGQTIKSKPPGKLSNTGWKRPDFWAHRVIHVGFHNGDKNVRAHPGAVAYAFEETIRLWDSIRGDPQIYAMAILKKENGNYWEDWNKSREKAIENDYDMAIPRLNQVGFQPQTMH